MGVRWPIFYYKLDVWSWVSPLVQWFPNFWGFTQGPDMKFPIWYFVKYRYFKNSFCNGRKPLSQNRKQVEKNSFMRNSLHCPYFSHFTSELWKQQQGLSRNVLEKQHSITENLAYFLIWGSKMVAWVLDSVLNSNPIFTTY